LSVFIIAINPIGTLLTDPIIAGSNVTQLGRNTALQCTVFGTAPEIATVTVDWTITALSANISNQIVNIFGNVVSEILHLANVDSGYCGVYTCTVADINTTPRSASISVSVGEYQWLLYLENSVLNFVLF
jgi:hypothetical protein